MLNTEAVTVGQLKQAVGQRLAKDQYQLIRSKYPLLHQSTGDTYWLEWAANNESEDTVFLDDVIVNVYTN